MKKYLVLMLAAILCMATFAGCAQNQETQSGAESSVAPEVASEVESEPEPEAAKEKLIVGLDDTFAPMGFRDKGGNLVGFDIDLATAVSEQMGVEIEFQPIDWDSKEMELNANNIDCIWNGMSRTPAREESMTLSQNYLNNKIIIMTTPELDITAKEQLAECMVGTQAESSALEVIEADPIYGDIKENLSQYPTYDECILDMLAGRTQAMIVDEVLGQYKNNNLETKFNVSPVDFGEDFYVIGFRKADTELCGRVEEAIKALQQSGKAAEISEKWFGADLVLPMQ